MSIAGRRLLTGLAVIAALVVAAVAGLLLSLPYLVDLPRVQALLRAEASRLLDRPVRFEHVSLSYWPLPAVRVRRLTVDNPAGFGPDPLLAVEEARVRVRLLPLLRGRLQFGEMVLSRPRVVVEQRRDGAWNLPMPRVAQAAPFVLVSHLRLAQGNVEIRIPGAAGRPVPAHLVDQIDVALEELGWNRPIGFKLGARLPGGGITLALEGHLGPLAAAGPDLGAVPLAVAARFAAEEAKIPPGAPFAVTGRGEGDVRAQGTLGRMRGSGRLQFERLTVAYRSVACAPHRGRPLTLEAVDLPIEIAGPAVAIWPFSLRLAGGSLRGEAVLTWQAGTPGVQMSGVRVQGVAAEPILVDFLCRPYAVSGRLAGTGDLAFSGVGDDLLSSARGAWQFRVDSGRLVGPAMLALLSGVVRVGAALYSVVNLDAPAALFVSPLEFDTLVARGAVGDGQVRVREMTMTSRRLRATGNGAYGLLDASLDFLVNARVGRSSFSVRIGGTDRFPTVDLAPGGERPGLAEPPGRRSGGGLGGQPGPPPPVQGPPESR